MSDIHQLYSLAHFPFLPSLSLLFPSPSFLIPHSRLFPSRSFQSPPVFLYLSSPITSILFLRYSITITPYQFLRFLYPAAVLHFSLFFSAPPFGLPFPPGNLSLLRYPFTVFFGCPTPPHGPPPGPPPPQPHDPTPAASHGT